jgi:hypothetical protein
MPATGLTGPYSLTPGNIDRNVATRRIGAYVLGHTTGDSFYVDYAGRSDDDVGKRLKDHANEGKYKEFKYGYLPSAVAAFEKECNLYHDFSPSGNTIHPDRPKGSNMKCPRCKQLG